MERADTVVESLHAPSSDLVELKKDLSSAAVQDYGITVAQFRYWVAGVAQPVENVFKSKTTVGRRDENDIVIKANVVSGFHLVIYVESDGSISIEDQGSSNGSRLVYTETNVVGRVVSPHGDQSLRSKVRYAYPMGVAGVEVEFGKVRGVHFQLHKVADPPKPTQQPQSIEALAETQVLPELDDETPPAAIRGSKLAGPTAGGLSPTLASFMAAPQFGNSSSSLMGGSNGQECSKGPPSHAADIDATLDFGYGTAVPTAGGGVHLPATVMSPEEEDAVDVDATLRLHTISGPDTTLAPTLVVGGASPGADSTATRPDVQDSLTEDDDDDIPPPLSNTGSRSAKMEAVLAVAVGEDQEDSCPPTAKKCGPSLTVVPSQSEDDEEPPSPTLGAATAAGEADVVGSKRGRPSASVAEDKALDDERPKAPALRQPVVAGGSSGSLVATPEIPEVVKPPLPEGLRGGLGSSSSSASKAEEDEETPKPAPTTPGKRGTPAAMENVANLGTKEDEAKHSTITKRGPSKKVESEGEEEDTDVKAPGGIRGGAKGRAPPAVVAAVPTPIKRAAPKKATSPTPSPPAAPKVRWQFKQDLRKKADREEAWSNYSDSDSALIETGFQAWKAAKTKTKKVSQVTMPGKVYICHFSDKSEDLVQSRADDFERQRPIRRVVG